MSEWLKEHAWKVCMRETVSRVRIPLSPQIIEIVPSKSWVLFFLQRVKRFGTKKQIAMSEATATIKMI
jgi:hypothetical protein